MSKNPTDPRAPRGQDPYAIDKLAKIPVWVKASVIKFWCAGAAFYFAVLGLPEAYDYLDRMVLMTLVLILGVEYLVIPAIRWMKTADHDTAFHLPHEIRRRSVWSLVATAVYVAAIVVLSDRIWNLWVSLGLPTLSLAVSEATADPFSFGFLFLFFDFIWMWIRALLKRLSGRKRDAV
ncbi:MAG: hypothetical protein A2Y16_03000 [Tenericutes bacterium GWF2_57_13]|nr:MAG: hypothetical protein A2Y16_03000 [Tenericutes bacterium GWF2_57_13]